MYKYWRDFSSNCCRKSVMDFSIRFSGHETFALRYGWLNKAYKFLNYNEKNEESLVVDLGVGKNMVNSIKYWAEITGLKPLNDTSVKQRYFSDITQIIEHFDPYLEKPESNWLLHYFIQKNYSELTFARWYFNFSNSQYFTKENLLNELSDWLLTENQKIPAIATLQKDFDCFILCYSKKSNKKFKGEDSFVSPLNELKLIYDAGSSYAADFSEHKDIQSGVFLYCLVDFWKTYFPDSSTISVDSILTMPGSPGRLFRFNNFGIDSYLNQCANLDKRFYWSDSKGIRSLACDAIRQVNLDSLLENIYSEMK